MCQQGESWSRLGPTMMARLPRRPQTYWRSSAAAAMTNLSKENDEPQWLLPQHLAMEEQQEVFVGGLHHLSPMRTAPEPLQPVVQILRSVWWISIQKKEGDAVLKFWHC